MLGMDPVAAKPGSDTDSSKDEQEDTDGEVGDTTELWQLFMDIHHSGLSEHSVNEWLFNLQCAAVTVNINDHVRL